MATDIVITGTGFPVPDPKRAGPGVLIRAANLNLQFDAGRSTTQRIVEAEVPLVDLTAFFATHHHSDHLLGLADLVLARWMRNGARAYRAPAVHCPAGPAVEFVERLLEPLELDLASRREVSGYPDDPHPQIVAFDAPESGPVRVAEVGGMSIDAASVDHGDLAPAVAYRFTTPDGVIVISGDTCACEAVEELAAGADILVHEVFAASLLTARGLNPSRIENLGHHHTEAIGLGSMAARLETPLLVTTHMIPAPESNADRDHFERRYSTVATSLPSGAPCLPIS